MNILVLRRAYFRTAIILFMILYIVPFRSRPSPSFVDVINHADAGADAAKSNMSIYHTDETTRYDKVLEKSLQTPKAGLSIMLESKVNDNKMKWMTTKPVTRLISSETSGSGLLTGNIWYDANGNGIRGDDEGADLSAAAIHIASKAENVVYTAFPNLSTGNFEIDKINPGSYSVYVSKPSQYLECTGDVDVECMLDTLVITLGQETELKIGLFIPADLAGRVWNDSDNDGAINYYSESFVASVPVMLLTDDGDVYKQTETNEYGQFNFQGLVPGVYKVKLQKSSAYGCTELNCTSNALTIKAGESRRMKIGVYSYAKVQGTICISYDLSIGDECDGLEGVKISLYSNNTNTLVQTQSTDENGAFNIVGLEPDIYFILVTKPDGFEHYQFSESFEESPLSPRFRVQSGKTKIIDAILYSALTSASPSHVTTEYLSSKPTYSPSVIPVSLSDYPIPTTTNAPTIDPGISYYPNIFQNITQEPSPFQTSIASSIPRSDFPSFGSSPSPMGVSPGNTFSYVTIIRLVNIANLSFEDVVLLQDSVSVFVESNAEIEGLGTLIVSVTVGDIVPTKPTGKPGGLEDKIIGPVSRLRLLARDTDLLVMLRLDVVVATIIESVDIETLLENCFETKFSDLASMLSDSSESFAPLVTERSESEGPVLGATKPETTQNVGKTWRMTLGTVLGVGSLLMGLMLMVLRLRVINQRHYGLDKSSALDIKTKNDDDLAIVCQTDIKTSEIQPGATEEMDEMSSNVRLVEGDCSAQAFEKDVERYFKPEPLVRAQTTDSDFDKDLSRIFKDYAEEDRDQEMNIEIRSHPDGSFPRAIFSPTGASMLSTIPSGSFESLSFSGTEQTVHSSEGQKEIETTIEATTQAPRMTFGQKIFGSCFAPNIPADRTFIGPNLLSPATGQPSLNNDESAPPIKATKSAPLPLKKTTSLARKFLEDFQYDVQQTRSMPTLLKSQSNIYEIFAPPGPLGLIIDSSANGPVVHGIKLDSPLFNVIAVGDIICALDGVDTREMPANVLTSIMARRMTKHRRLTILGFLGDDDESLETYSEEVEI